MSDETSLVADAVDVPAEAVLGERSGARIAYGTVGRLAGRLLGALLSLAALHMATHYFGSREWGSIAAALAWVGVFAALGSAGITTYTMREVGRPGADRAAVFGSGLRSVTLVSLISAALALAFGAAAYSSQSSTFLLVALALCWVPFTAWFQLGGGVLAALGRSDLRGFLDVASSALLILATILVVRVGLGDAGYVLLASVSVGLSALLAIGLAALWQRPQLAWRRREDMAFIAAAIPFGQVAIIAAIYSRADSLMLYFLKGRHDIAIYSVAYQVLIMVAALPGFLMGALVRDFMSASPDRRAELSRHAFNVSLIVAAPVPMFAAIFARPFVAWLAGPTFYGGAAVLIVLSFAAAIALMNAMMFQLGVYADTDFPLWRITFVVTAVNLVANGVAIPLFGALGSAWALIGSEIVGSFFYWRMFRRATRSRIGIAMPLAVLAAVAVVAAGWWGADSAFAIGPGHGISMVPRAAVVGICYLGLVVALERVFRRSIRSAPAKAHDGADGAAHDPEVQR